MQPGASERRSVDAIATVAEDSRAIVAALRACVPRASQRDGPTRTKTQKRRGRRGRAAAAREKVKRVRSPPPAEWVVDTGASSHICPPSATQGAQRAARCLVETANGIVAAAGRATVYVPGVRSAVEAVVLPKSPCLLSMGLLAQRGYELRWGPDGCALQLPGGEVVPLQVDGGVPVLCTPERHGAVAAGRKSLGTRACALASVRTSVSDDQRQGDTTLGTQCVKPV